MAKGNGPTAGFRASTVRLRKEGERLAARIDRDVRSLAKRTRSDFATDVRQLEGTLRAKASDAVRHIEQRTQRIVGGVEKRATRATEDVLKRLHAATRSEMTSLVRRVRDLEARVAALEGLAADESSSSV